MWHFIHSHCCQGISNWGTPTNGVGISLWKSRMVLILRQQYQLKCVICRQISVSAIATEMSCYFSYLGVFDLYVKFLQKIWRVVVRHVVEKRHFCWQIYKFIFDVHQIDWYTSRKKTFLVQIRMIFCALNISGALLEFWIYGYHYLIERPY